MLSLMFSSRITIGKRKEGTAKAVPERFDDSSDENRVFIPGDGLFSCSLFPPFGRMYGKGRKELFVMEEHEYWYDRPLDGTFVVIMVAATFMSLIIIGAFAQP